MPCLLDILKLSICYSKDSRCKAHDNKIHTVIILVTILIYHFHTPHTDHIDSQECKSHILKTTDRSCEGGACEEKDDHIHEHKKRRKGLINTIYGHKTI